MKKLLTGFQVIYGKIQAISEKYLKLNILTILGVLIFSGLFYQGLVVLPQKINIPAVFILLLLGTAALLQGNRRSEKVICFVLLTAIFFLPITWVWRGVYYEANVFSGIFPLWDSNWFLTDAMRLLSGLNFTQYATRRPIYTGVLAFLLWISGKNLFFAVGSFGVLTGVSVAFLAREVRKLAGALTAATLLVLSFYYMLSYQGQILTENIGLALGALGLAILLRGVGRGSRALIALGVFSLTAGLNARAGAFFVLPAILVWALFERRRLPKYASLWVAGSILIGFALNLGLTKLLGSQDGLAFANFSMTLYGLAAGYKGWFFVGGIYPGATDAQIYGHALDLIKASPQTLVYGMLRSVLEYFKSDNMVSYLRLDYFQTPLRLVVYLCTWLGFFRMLRLRKDLTWSLGLWMLAGCLLSITFLPPIDAGSRPLAATIPVNGLLAGFLFFRSQSQTAPEVQSKIQNFVPEILVLALMLLIFTAPFLVRASGHLPSAPTGADCPAGDEKLTMDLFPGGYMSVISAGPAYASLPEVRMKDITNINKVYPRGQFPEILLDFPSLYNFIRSLTPGQTLLMGVTHQDLLSPSGPDKVIFVVAQTKSIATFNGTDTFCAVLLAEERLNANRFYLDRSIDPALFNIH